MRALLRSAMASAVVAVALTASVSAAAPTSVVIPSVDYDDPFVCGGAPTIHVSYTTTFRLATWTDRDGTVVRDAIFAPRTRVILTDASTGRSLSGRSPAVFRTRYAADGSVLSLTVTGLNAAITVPGEGVILLDTGRISWAGGFMGPVLAESGPHGWQGSGDHQAFCDYFSA